MILICYVNFTGQWVHATAKLAAGDVARNQPCTSESTTCPTASPCLSAEGSSCMCRLACVLHVPYGCVRPAARNAQHASWPTCRSSIDLLLPRGRRRSDRGIAGYRRTQMYQRNMQLGSTSTELLFRTWSVQAASLIGSASNRSHLAWGILPGASSVLKLH